MEKEDKESRGESKILFPSLFTIVEFGEDLKKKKKNKIWKNCRDQGLQVTDL